jgi:ferritin-like metal-binding protein YciE
MAVKDNTIAGYDKNSVWAQIFGRDRVAELLKTMLDKEEATYRRLMELARRARPPAVHHAIA